MTPEMLFQSAGLLALIGWGALALSPLRPDGARVVAGTVIPLLFALAYGGLVLAFWAGAEGGFRSLAEVARLFGNPWLLLAGWVHYLCFDLLVGAWIVDQARARGIPHLLVLPCLALCFLFGPAGFLLFWVLRLAQGRAFAKKG